jgi:propane monooxygenase large subunit
LDKWDRWVRDDWHRAYIMKLGKLGLDIPPDIFERARERIVAGVHHRHAIFMFAAWPFANWRMDPLDERDFEWFEDKYPGWYSEYGAFFEAYRHGLYPDGGFMPLEFINLAPPSCWTCQGFCVSETDRRHRVVEQRTRFYCSPECAWMDESNPGRYTGDRNFFDRYDGWEASEVVRYLGFVRADGVTTIGQPHLESDRRWTLEDIRKNGITIRSPNIRVARELGLPTGDHSDCVPGDGSVPIELAVADLATGAPVA